MEQMARIQYVNAALQIGLVHWRQAWLLSGNPPQQLSAEVYKGKLIFRIPGTSRRFSYQRVKKGLQKTTIIIQEPNLPF